ncbi:MAG: hypothetical protein K5650_04660 [Bacteroidales bacterium]|nr:hypothetical protein [Bacteroidales bacterium]
MFKKVLILSAAMVLAFGLKAQTIMETTCKVGDFIAPALVMSIEKDVKLTQDAMRQRLKDTKLKVKNVDGYVAILDQKFEQIAPTPVNFYTKVEEMGQRKDRTTMVTVCAMTNDLTIDQQTVQANVRLFLQDFAGYVVRYEAQQNMEAQQDNLKKAQKASDAAVSALSSLEKDIASDQQKIADKQKDIEKYKAKIAECEQDIKNLQAGIEKKQGKKDDAQKKVDATGQTVRETEGEVERYRQQAQ